MSYESELRRTGDEFVLTACVWAAEEGVAPEVVMLTALADAVARLNEIGALGKDSENK